jgi:hypothetical protein
MQIKSIEVSPEGPYKPNKKLYPQSYGVALGTHGVSLLIK